MFQNKIAFLILLVAGCHLVTSCEINIRDSSPLFTKSLGSKTIVFKPQGNNIQLHIGESITAYCQTEIEYTGSDPRTAYSGHRLPQQYEDDDENESIREVPELANVLKITCTSNNKIAYDNRRSTNSYNTAIYCKSSTVYDLYESNKILPSCEKYMSYAIGIPIQRNGSKIIAGLCYDIDKFELKYASYVSYRYAANFGEQKNSNELSLNLDEMVGSLKNYYPFMRQEHFNWSRDSSQNELFNAFEFDLTNLLQDKTLSNEIKDFDYIFTTMWWRQLRQQNWHHFLKALHERSQSVKYLVYTGTYGNATMPTSKSNCSSTKGEVVSVNTEETTVQAPAYIWAYLKAITNVEQEQDIVVIAHNSPYVTNPGHSEFCNVDICDEVDWLKQSAFGTLRRLPTLGYTFCCRPEEVAKIIDYFPISTVDTATQRPKESPLVKNVKADDQ